MKGHRREKRPGVHELIVSVGRDPATGKYRQVSRTFHGGARKADAALRELVAEVEAGQYGGASSTLGALLDDWLRLIQDERSPTTLREYRRLIDKQIRPALGSIPLRRLTAKELDDFYGAHPKSARQMHAIIRAALHQAMRWDLVSRNVASQAKAPKAPGSERRATPVDVVPTLIASSPDAPTALLVLLAAATSARRGELCGLRWGDVDWEKGNLTICRSVAVVQGGTVVKDTKTHAARVVSQDDVTLEVLRNYRARADDLHRQGHNPAVTDETPILTYDGARPMHPDKASHAVRELATACGVDTHLHALRHMGATQMVAGGHDIRTVATRLGHANPNMTLNVYAHALPERDRAAAEHLGALIRGDQAKELTP